MAHRGAIPHPFGNVAKRCGTPADGYGNVVRRSTIEPENLEDMKVHEENGRDVDCWSDGRIGSLYKRQGR
ncbi:hypothetical protein ColKHC_12766 [Colletotrichum higginsianum]|nr:hypothetical protein ColKHC_12766 [Colletotrichum higginsianum]